MVVFKTTDGGFTYSNGFKIQQSYVVSHRFDVADGPLMLLAIFVDPSSFFLNKCLGPTWCFCYSFGLFQLASCLGSVVLFVLFSLVLSFCFSLPEIFSFRRAQNFFSTSLESHQLSFSSPSSGRFSDSDFPQGGFHPDTDA